MRSQSKKENALKNHVGISDRSRRVSGVLMDDFMFYGEVEDDSKPVFLGGGSSSSTTTTRPSAVQQDGAEQQVITGNTINPNRRAQRPNPRTLLQEDAAQVPDVEVYNFPYQAPPRPPQKPAQNSAPPAPAKPAKPHSSVGPSAKPSSSGQAKQQSLIQQVHYAKKNSLNRGF